MTRLTRPGRIPGGAAAVAARAYALNHLPEQARAALETADAAHAVGIPDAAGEVAHETPAVLYRPPDNYRTARRISPLSC
ncbi:hypothetical protein [Streptomyces sp. MB09-02B]|uniref:hypothetical protein n=1 Tax=Streptomyces sp. MB09-02B TaxID=3028667 RepID=UPI0029ADBF0B|nr:hypothetical protein [Streptomyces sp. MB09-02B]MDX3641391.1 hypothetical protein [Streptomyces sp. MB09-02B]